jgi:hypothetical protein
MNKENIGIDPTREAIAAKIDDKRKATENIAVKKEGIGKRVSMYETAVANHEAKRVAAEKLLEDYRASFATQEALEQVRLDEIEHMEEILDRYDTAYAERANATQTMVDRMEAIPDWMPGMDPELKGALTRDPEYKEALKQKLYLDQVLEAAWSDVKKIYSNRGEVSGFNVKGRQGV